MDETTTDLLKRLDKVGCQWEGLSLDKYLNIFHCLTSNKSKSRPDFDVIDCYKMDKLIDKINIHVQTLLESTQDAEDLLDEVGDWRYSEDEEMQGM